MSSESHEASQNPDGRVTALKQRLDEAFFEMNHGEYFRSRVHGWAAYVQDSNVELRSGIADRIGNGFTFSRDDAAEDIATVDAFVIAYHAAETFWRYLFGVLDGSGPERAPLVSMAGLKAGSPFNDRVERYLALSEANIHEVLDKVFLPDEVKADWGSDPSLGEVQEYLVLWWRELARFVNGWRNAYNSAKHGLAVGVRPRQWAFVGADEDFGPPLDLMNGPVMRTLEYESHLDSQGRRIKRSSAGQPILRWFWMYRAIDPDELIAQAVVTADLLDWLRAIAGARLLGQAGTSIHVRDEPKPQTLKRRSAPGQTLRIDIAAVPLPPEQVSALRDTLISGDTVTEPDGQPQ